MDSFIRLEEQEGGSLSEGVVVVAVVVEVPDAVQSVSESSAKDNYL